MFSSSNMGIYIFMKNDPYFSTAQTADGESRLLTAGHYSAGKTFW